MAEIAAKPFVSFVVKSLGDLLIQEARFLSGVRDQVQQLQIELERMQCLLLDADAKQERNNSIRNCVAEIREVSYDAEDVIETFVLKVALRRRSGILNVLVRYSCVVKDAISRHKVGMEIRSVETNIFSIRTNLQALGIIGTTTRAGDRSSSSNNERPQRPRQSYPHIIAEKVNVGLDEDIQEVLKHLVKEERQYCRVVSIWGMGGIGKTTLAKMVYRDSDVRRYFDCFAWAYISQQCNTRDVLEGILIQLLSASDADRTRVEKLKDDELVEELYDIQSQKKCLVILDDIWDAKAWNSLSPAFPNTDPHSKILLTTRNSDVASFFREQNFDCFLYELKLLTKAESWELFEKTLSLRRREEIELSTEMRELGKVMVSHCGCLPLAIEVLGGLLGTKHTLDEWKAVSRDVNRYISEGKGHGGGVMDVLALSYQDLPYNLKACFLYLSHLPEDYGIRVNKLVQMWMAESIVSSSVPTRVGEAPREEETMLDVGMGYLGELVQRCMVQVQLTRFSRRVKLCRLHDLMRDLCLLKAQEENFFKVVRLQYAFNGDQLMCVDSTSSSSSSSSSSITTIRRLALYYLGKPDIDGRRYVNPLRGHEIITNRQHIRSWQFYSFGNYLNGSGWRQIKSLFDGCKLLRFLDLEGIKFSSGRTMMLPRAIGNLIHLRYLSIRDSIIKELPSSIGNLAFLQTLDFRVAYGTMRIPNVLWRLEQLRHLYLPTCIKGPCIGKLRLDGLSKLETLEGFDSRYFDVRCFSTLTNLRKLRVERAKIKDLAVILKSPTLSDSNSLLRLSSFWIQGNFRRENEQSLLKKLLRCHHLCALEITGGLNLVKLADQFPPNLTKLSLTRSKLEEDPMPTLEKLPNLRSLTLYFYSYIGKEMVCSAPAAASTPTAPSSSGGGSDGGFPRLKLLRLFGIPNLEEWRVEEGAMPTLFRLEINGCTKLKEIPEGLRFITTLRELVIGRVYEELLDRLREGGEDFYKVQHVPSIKISSVNHSRIFGAALDRTRRYAPH